VIGIDGAGPAFTAVLGWFSGYQLALP
jgi:hypothetical protein